MFFNSGPLSLRTRVGKVPLRIIQLANIRLVSLAVRHVEDSINKPWHRQQMYVIVYLPSALSIGLLGPSISIMTSSQQSLLVGITPIAGVFFGILRNLVQVKQESHHFWISSFIVSHHTCRERRRQVFTAFLCAPRMPTWHCKNNHLFQLKLPAACPSGTIGTHTAKSGAGRCICRSSSPSVERR